MATTSKFDFGLINDQIANKANAIASAHNTTYGTDLNNYTETGMYGIEGATNYPAGDSENQYGTLTVNRYSNTNYVTQIWQTVLSNQAWIRIKNGSTWSAWNKLAIGPYNGLDSTSTTAALSAAQGKILNNMLFGATNEAYASSTFTDTWLLTAKNGAYKVSGGNIVGTIIEGAISSYGLILVFTSVPYNADSGIEEYGVIFYADANNNLYHRNFYRKKSQNNITWRGALKKITAS